MVDSHLNRDIGRVFVGRQRELAELRAALEESLTGHGRLVMQVGEPGIGKTRTAQELASYAETRGCLVLWGRCFEGEGAPPYWPWVQPIRSYVQHKDAEQLSAEMGPGAADIAEIVAEIRPKLPDLETPPALEQEQARFRLFDSIATFLKNAAQAQPLVLVLDDLHWADKPSLLLLQFLARELAGSPLLVVGCYRDVELSREHPLSETLAQLSREPVFQRVPMRGLSQDETGQFIEASAGIEPTTGLVEALYSHTEGNPFFMTEVIRLLSESGELTAGHIGTPEELRIPQGVREVIGQRLNRLSERCNEVLTTASIVGREFDFRLLNTLSGGMSEDQLLQAVDEAVSVHLIEEMPDTVDRYQFSHALVQQALAEELTTSRRARLHARIAETLEEWYGADAPVHAAELAHHFAEAGPVLGPEKLVQYSRLAGEQALAAYAWEDALAHFQRAMDAEGSQLMDAEAAALLFGLARAQAATLDREHRLEAVANLRRVFDYYVEAGDVDGAVTVAEYPVRNFKGATWSAGIADLLSRALALVPPDSHQYARLLSSHGFNLYGETGDYEGAQASLERALIIARREGDAALEMRALADAAHVHFFQLQPQQAVECAIRALDLAERVNDPMSEVVAHYSAMNAVHPLGDLAGAQRHAEAMLAPAERLRDRYWLVSALSRNEIVFRLKGEWRTARGFSDRALAVLPRDPRVLGYRVVLDYETGEYDQAEAYVERLVEVMRARAPGPSAEYAYTAMALQLVAKISGRMEWLDVGEQAAKAVISSPFVTTLHGRRAHAALGLAAVLQRDPERAAEQYAALDPARGTMLSGGFATADRLLGLLSQTIGLGDQASAHFEDALVFCRKADYRPELAWSCHDYAEMLLRAPRSVRGAPTRTDHEKATSLLEEALNIAQELGMRPLLERVGTLQDPARSSLRPAPEYPGGLSQREVEVLRLISAGKTDREIAEELVISPLTVGNHVKNILNKTNTSNRTEAATYAAHQGLT